MKTCYVFIYLEGQTKAVPAGIFSYDPVDRQGIFQYGRRYLEREDAIPVDYVALPLGREPIPVFSNDGIYGAFRDSSPDYWGRTVMAYDQKVPFSALDEVDFLLLGNSSRTGNLDFRRSLNDPEPEYQPPSYQSIDDLINASQLLQQSQPIRKDLEQLLMQGSTIGGARPKCTVEWNGGLWIAKFPSHGDDFDNSLVEYATMTLAKKAGINVPEVQLLTIGDRNVLMVRRFDRQICQSGYTRKGFLSALSFMEWDQSDRNTFSYVAIAERMRRLGMGVSLDPQELYKRMIFNVLCRNTDDHPRNHGFIVCRDKISLSPAYDLSPSVARQGVGTDFSLAMEIGANGRHASLENLLSKHASFGLRIDEAKMMIAQVAKVISGWEAHFRDSGVSIIDAEKFRGSFDTHILTEALSCAEDHTAESDSPSC